MHLFPGERPKKAAAKPVPVKAA
jgi:hypothetical protein